MNQDSPELDPSRQRRGIFYGVAAYGLWGAMPLYIHYVGNVAPLEILAHRALWSFVLLLVAAALLDRWRAPLECLRSPTLAARLALSALLISSNWLLFIYAVESHQVLQSSLAYFATPLVNVFFGVLFLGERLRPLQVASLLLAAVALAVRVAAVGHWPWLAISLAGTFAFYSLLRKTMTVDAFTALTVETLAMIPLALAFLSYLYAAGRSDVTQWSTLGRLLWAGPITVVPLLFFGAAVLRLRLSTLGFLQYLTPTLTFLQAVLLFDEPFTWGHAATFALIWSAVGFYCYDGLRHPATARPELEPD